MSCASRGPSGRGTKNKPVKFYYYLVLLVMMPFIVGAHVVHRFGPFGERDKS
jgi:hypothetical protein